MSSHQVKRTSLVIGLIAAAMPFSSASNAQVSYTDWFGGGVLTSSTNCPTGSLDQHVNKVFTVRFLPAGVATNGANSSLSIINQHYAQGYTRMGSFTSALQTVTAQTIARFPGPSGYPVKVAFTKQTPATIDATTPMISLTIKVTGFTGFPSNQNCTAVINATVFRP